MGENILEKIAKRQESIIALLAGLELDGDVDIAILARRAAWYRTEQGQPPHTQAKNG